MPTGTAGNEVVFTGYGVPVGNDWQAITLAGSATDKSTWDRIIVDHGLNAVVIRGASTLSNVTVHAGGGDGIALINSTGASLTDVTVDGAGHNDLFTTRPDLLDVIASHAME